MVGAVRFELTTSCTRNTRASQATLRPVPSARESAFGPSQMQFLFRPPIEGLSSRPLAAKDLAQTMIGTIINSAAILIGGVIGLATTRDFSPTTQARLKILLGAFTVYAGLSMAWNGFAGSISYRAAQLGIAMVAMMAGKVSGRLLHLQRAVNDL